MARPLRAGPAGRARSRALSVGGFTAALVFAVALSVDPGSHEAPLAIESTGSRAVPRARALTGLASETLDNSATEDSRSSRAERRKARKEAARAKRQAARELRVARAQERREARKAKRGSSSDRRAEAKEARREAAEARREARKAKRAAAKERYAAVIEARRERADERREAAKEKRETARERRAEARQARIDAKNARREAAREKRESARARRESADSEDRSQEPVASSTSMDGRVGRGPSGSAGGGILRVNSLPWAQVFIDGRMVGHTPQLGIPLPTGEHAVQLVNPVFNMRKTFQVRIAQGDKVTRREILEE